jgi:hypothetical protein
MKNLIIGKNSKIVAKIRHKLVNYDFISNTEILDVDFNKYKYIYLFSWDHSSNDNNLKNIATIPSNKIIFISTIAVLSLQKRGQWQNYPNNKKIIENHVIEKKGTILRLGVFDNDNLKNYFGNVPITTYEMLIDFLNSSKDTKESIINLIDIKKSQLSIKSFFWKKFYNLSFFLPSKVFFQIFFSGIPKIFNFKSYGYSADCSEYCFTNVQIGYGVFGSRIKKIKIDKYISSFKNDITKNTNGFNGTIIGYKDNGLSKFWHGVKIKNDKKKTPLFIKRSSSPKNTFKLHVKKISYDFNNFKITCENKYKKNIFIYSTNIILSAGTFENIKLLSNLSKIKNTTFSDHEQGLVGKILLKNAIDQNLIKSFWFFIFNKKVIRYHVLGYQLMIEFRPDVLLKKNSNYSNFFYAQSIGGIFLKLIKSLSLSRINEAFYNKFGIGIKTKKLNIFMQIKNSNCIKYENGEFIRSRIDLIKINQILEQIRKKIIGLKKIENIELCDAQHTVGGANLLDDEIIKDLLSKNRLKIYGSPSNFDLTSTHHTFDYIDWYNKNN